MMKTVRKRIAWIGLVLMTMMMLLPVATHAAPSTSGQPARSVLVRFHNATAFPLKRLLFGVSHGTWTSLPPTTVAAGATVTWSTASDGILTGTEGSVQYVLPTDAPKLVNMSGTRVVSIHWDNPFAGSNSYDGSAPQWFTLSHTGGSGNNAVVDIVLTQVVDQLQQP